MKIIIEVDIEPVKISSFDDNRKVIDVTPTLNPYKVAQRLSRRIANADVNDLRLSYQDDNGKEIEFNSHISAYGVKDE